MPALFGAGRGRDGVRMASPVGEGLAGFHGPEAAGRPYEMVTIHVYRTEGDRLAEHWGVRDEVGAMRQMGVIPPPQPPA